MNERNRDRVMYQKELKSYNEIWTNARQEIKNTFNLVGNGKAVVIGDQNTKLELTEDQLLYRPPLRSVFDMQQSLDISRRILQNARNVIKNSLRELKLISLNLKTIEEQGKAVYRGKMGQFANRLDFIKEFIETLRDAEGALDGIIDTLDNPPQQGNRNLKKNFEVLRRLAQMAEGVSDRKITEEPIEVDIQYTINI